MSSSQGGDPLDDNGSDSNSTIKPSGPRSPFLEAEGEGSTSASTSPSAAGPYVHRPLPLGRRVSPSRIAYPTGPLDPAWLNTPKLATIQQEVTAKRSLGRLEEDFYKLATLYLKPEKSEDRGEHKRKMILELQEELERQDNARYDADEMKKQMASAAGSGGSGSGSSDAPPPPAPAPDDGKDTTTPPDAGE